MRTSATFLLFIDAIAVKFQGAHLTSSPDMIILEVSSSLCLVAIGFPKTPRLPIDEGSFSISAFVHCSMLPFSLSLGSVHVSKAGTGYGLHLTASIEASSSLPPALALTRASLIDILTAREAWVTRGARCRLAIQLRLNGERPRDEGWRTSVAEALGQAFRESEVTLAHIGPFFCFFFLKCELLWLTFTHRSTALGAASATCLAFDPNPGGHGFRRGRRGHNLGYWCSARHYAAGSAR